MSTQHRLGPWILGGLLAMTATLLVAAGGGKGGLEPGGRTMLGPASITIPPTGVFNQEVAIFSQPLEVCITLVINKGNLEIDFIRNAGGSTIWVNLSAGETVGFCESGVDEIKLKCTGTKDCSLAWRIDQMWS